MLVTALSLAMLSGCAPDRPDPPLACLPLESVTESFRTMCEFMNTFMAAPEVVFVGGYASRTLAAGYRIFEDERYLQTAVAYADLLLERQSERGYWITGYSRNIYLADTGSALGLFMVLHPLVDGERQARYRAAVDRYLGALETDGLLLAGGPVGSGWKVGSTGALEVRREPYTISTALSGVELHAWLHAQTGDPAHAETAYRGLRWILSTMREDGLVPYIGDGGDPDVVGDPENDHVLHEKWPYNTATYVGEGIIAFDTHVDVPEWRAEIRAAVKPYIEFIVRTQNDDGTWGTPGSDDRSRAPGTVNLLHWYHRKVEARGDIAAALCRFAEHMSVTRNARAYGLASAGAKPGRESAIATVMTARAFTDLLRPGVDVIW